MHFTQTAYAKINLALHVRKRRDDGYHEIETAFAFVDGGDRISVASAEQDTLHVVGEFGGVLGDPLGDNPFGNIVAKALGSLPRQEGWAVTLEKNLPVAAGLGGGSADAGAIFRLVRGSHGLPDDWHERAAKLGADVPACVDSQACIGIGIGTQLAPLENDLAGAPVLIVNPRIPLSTAEVYKAWDGVDRGALPEGPASVMALEGRNDLESAAIAARPQIAECLKVLDDGESWLVRMSGSGASCFALYHDSEARDKAAQSLAANHPDWWQLKGNLR